VQHFLLDDLHRPRCPVETPDRIAERLLRDAETLDQLIQVRGERLGRGARPLVPDLGGDPLEVALALLGVLGGPPPTVLDLPELVGLAVLHLADQLGQLLASGLRRDLVVEGGEERGTGVGEGHRAHLTWMSAALASSISRMVLCAASSSAAAPRSRRCAASNSRPAHSPNSRTAPTSFEAASSCPSAVSSIRRLPSWSPMAPVRPALTSRSEVQESITSFR